MEDKQNLVYKYHPITGEYVCMVEADVNPFNQEELILPACTTTEEPLPHKKGNAVVWVGNKWQYKADHRNEMWFNSKTLSTEIIDFIGDLPSNYYSPDSVIANKPEGNYWHFDSANQKWVGNAGEYKLYLEDVFSYYWNIKLNTPFEVNGFSYIPAWRELYTSIYVSLNDGIKEEYTLQDFNGNYNTVNKKSFKEIYSKMANINDELYYDKHKLEKLLVEEDKFDKLQNAFQEWLNKEYK